MNLGKIPPTFSLISVKGTLTIEIVHYLVNSVAVQFDLQFGAPLLVTADKAVHLSL